MLFSLRRSCIYETGSLRPPEHDAIDHMPDISKSTNVTSTSSIQPYRPAASVGSSLSFTDIITSVDPFTHDALRQPTVDVIVQKQLLQIIGSRSAMHQIADTYFASMSKRLSILSAQRFYERLPKIESPNCAADFAALCLCIHLISQVPKPQDNSMQSSLYVTVKNINSLLEAATYHSLEAVQCRLLVAFYEIGHGIYPAAAASIGACAKLAHFAGFRRRSVLYSEKDESEIVMEEKRRTLWALHNLDRYGSPNLLSSLISNT